MAGHPIGHSLSPVLHAAGYRALGLPWRFDRLDIERGGLAAAVDGLVAGVRGAPGASAGAGDDGSWRGLAVTMPLKQEAAALAGRSGARAATDVVRLGAANTVLIEPDGTLRIDNTDVPGLRNALAEAGRLPSGRVVVLGGGGTAAAAVAALAPCNVPVTVVVRDAGRAVGLRSIGETYGVNVTIDTFSRLGESGLGGVDVVVSTVPAPAHVAVADAVVGAVEAVGRAPLLFDVVYAPWPTGLAARWATRGWPVIGGLELLIHQAVVQFELMTGCAVPAAVLREAGERALAERG